MLLTTEVTVKSLVKFIDWEHTVRSATILHREGQLNILGMLATWSDSQINRCYKNYITRINKGKVKVFYVDLVKHTYEEMKQQIEKGPSTIVYNKDIWIRKVNKFYRLSAYYSAVSELAPNHLSPE